MKKIGFIGIGIMGEAMAGHLLDAGYALTVYNRTKAKAQGLIDRGALWCDTAGDCAKNQDIVITIVGYPKDVEEVYLGTEGILANAKKGAYVLDMTTSSPILAKKIYDTAKEKGIYAIDAPVTGGDTGAKTATLSIMVGGEEAAIEAVRPVLEKIGTTIVHAGSAGAGQKTKMCNQIAIAGALAGACEALSYAKASGLDVKKTLTAIAGGAAGSFQLSNVAAKGLQDDFNPGFMLKHFIKDLQISYDTGLQYELQLPILKQVLSEAKNLEEKGLGTEGTQSLLKFYKK